MTLRGKEIGMRAGLVALVLATLALFAAPRAEANYLYWTTFPENPADPGTVGRANIDGSGANNNFISAPDGACGVAANASNVFWGVGDGAPGSPGYVGRADLSGGAIDNTFIETTNNFNCGVAVNAGSIFFNNHAIGAIGRANLDGSGVEQEFVTGGDNPQHPAVNSTHLFWTNKDGQSVGRATLAGGDVNQELVNTSCKETGGVAANDEYVYWGNTSCASIGRAKLTTGGVTDIEPEFIKLSEGPCGLAIDGNHIYWGRFGEQPGSFVGRANLDGSGVNEQFVATAPYVCSVAVGPDTSAPISAPTPSFKLKPPVRCTKGCKRVLVTFEFDAAGTVVAKQAMPPKKGKAKGKGKAGAKARSSAGGKAKGKRPKKLIKRLSQSVAAGTVTLRLKTTGAGKAMVKKTGKLKVKVDFTYTPAGAAATTVRHTLKVKPPKPKAPKHKAPKHKAPKHKAPKPTKR